jgi:hypothetical protein
MPGFFALCAFGILCLVVIGYVGCCRRGDGMSQWLPAQDSRAGVRPVERGTRLAWAEEDRREQMGRTLLALQQDLQRRRDWERQERQDRQIFEAMKRVS